MHSPLRQQLLDQTIALITQLRPLVESVARHDRELASQIRRASSSIALNLAEGFGSKAGNARLRFDSARGSLYEATAGLRVAVAWGYLTENAASEVLDALDALGARVYGLCRG